MYRKYVSLLLATLYIVYRHTAAGPGRGGFRRIAEKRLARQRGQPGPAKAEELGLLHRRGGRYI
jgi:hypothetical protein